MSFNSVYYWMNFLEKDKKINVKPDSYVLNFFIVNQSSNDSFYKWYSFDTLEEVIGFIKLVVLPSGYYSRIFGKEHNDIVIAVENYNGVIDLLENNIVRFDQELIDNYKTDYELIEEVEKNFDSDLLDKFCESFNNHLELKDIVFSYIDVYENSKEFGIKLVSRYEKVDMIDELERQMEMSVEEIKDLFSSIDNNPFMLKKISKILNSNIII